MPRESIEDFFQWYLYTPMTTTLEQTKLNGYHLSKNESDTLIQLVKQHQESDPNNTRLMIMMAMYVNRKNQLYKKTEITDILAPQYPYNSEATELLEKAITLGDPYSAYLLASDGRIYLDAKVPQNNIDLQNRLEQLKQQSYTLMKKSADMGFLLAVHKLAKKYLDGIGTDTNVPKAIELFHQCKDNYHSHNELSIYYCNDFKFNKGLYHQEQAKKLLEDHFQYVHRQELKDKLNAQLEDMNKWIKKIKYQIQIDEEMVAYWTTHDDEL
jgi:TPR repeat protein